VHDHFVGGEARTRQLPGQQVALGDEDLLVVGVAVETHEVHAVEQGRRNGVGHVAVAMNTTCDRSSSTSR